MRAFGFSLVVGATTLLLLVCSPNALASIPSRNIEWRLFSSSDSSCTGSVTKFIVRDNNGCVPTSANSSIAFSLDPNNSSAVLLSSFAGSRVCNPLTNVGSFPIPSNACGPDATYHTDTKYTRGGGCLRNDANSLVRVFGMDTNCEFQGDIVTDIIPGECYGTGNPNLFYQIEVPDTCQQDATVIRKLFSDPKCKQKTERQQVSIGSCMKGDTPDANYFLSCTCDSTIIHKK